MTPGNGWSNRNKYFSYAVSSCSSRPEMFVKCAYDYSSTSFISGARDFYNEKYFYVCKGGDDEDDD